MAVNKKYILLFIDNLGAGGAQRQLVGLAVMLKQRGYQVKVCYYQDVPFYAGMLDENDVPHELIQGSDNHKKRIPVVAKYFKKENPEWVIAFLDTPSLVASAAKVLGGEFKLIVSERNTTQKFGMNERVRFFLFRWADAIVPNSYAQEEVLAAHYPWMKSKLVTINNFVDLEKFQPEYKQRRKVPLIVVAASAWAPKNVLGFIEAVRLLKSRGVQMQIDWYGITKGVTIENDKYLCECSNMISKYELSGILRLLPKTKDIAAKYKEADYFCLPSFYEGTPNVICEAMASGLPVICSNVCDNPRYVHEVENGFLFDPHNPNDIAEKIEKALGMEETEYNRYCLNSRKLSEELLSEDAFIKKYNNIIESK